MQLIFFYNSMNADKITYTVWIKNYKITQNNI